MLYTIALLVLLALTIWFTWAYLRERKYRKKPFYSLSEIGWRTTSPPPLDQRTHSIAMVGDIGKNGSVEDDPLMQAVQSWINEAGENSTILLLGDNVYPTGLPPVESFRHPAAIQKLDYQLSLFQNYRGKVIYLSGNHDWNKGRQDGYSFVLRQEKYIIEKLQDNNAYLPRGGTLGPVTWEINDQLLILVINTQWWVQAGFKPLEKKPGEAYRISRDFYPALQALLEENKHRFIVLAAHHPLYSNALHGGKFTVKQHLFPLTFINKRALIPLPLAGSLFRLYRKYMGMHEDMSYPPYRKFRRRLLRILHQYNSIFYVAGHDHNLQYFQVKGNHYAVSGSGSKTNFVAKGGKASFAHENKGFMVLDQYKDGTIWLRVIEPALTLGEEPILAFQKCIYPAPVAPTLRAEAK
ncbi:metallophosphoesterase family protein [Rufibacter latericius]|uniref:Metallophosphoesterase n=1 Tax=Rufibacter latericius TaxID=2487040 RepID=A0A3M9MLW1_9BACT|nr:metallophosphoesterase [Rufibacter latericius]RNI26516.1 metallophosphoesterase [Rufibacter latericius]